MNGSVDDDFTQRECSLGLAAVVARKMQATRFVVDMRDPQALARGIGIGHAPGEEGRGRREAVELQREFGTLIPHGRNGKAAGASRPPEPHPK